MVPRPHPSPLVTVPVSHYRCNTCQYTSCLRLSHHLHSGRGSQHQPALPQGSQVAAVGLLQQADNTEHEEPHLAVAPAAVSILGTHILEADAMLCCLPVHLLAAPSAAMQQGALHLHTSGIVCSTHRCASCLRFMVYTPLRACMPAADTPDLVTSHLASTCTLVTPPGYLPALPVQGLSRCSACPGC
jgi:hypothetical protein